MEISAAQAYTYLKFMKSPYLSVIIEAGDCAEGSLPLTLIDLDNYLSKLEISYEVLILAKSEEVKGIESITKKFSKIIKNVVFRVVDPNPSKISHIEMNGSYGLLIKNMSIPTIDCLRSILGALDNDDLSKTSELVLGYHKESGISFTNILCRIIGSPVRLDAEHLIMGFNKNISASVLNIKKFGRVAFDIELAMLSQKLGYKIKEIPLFFRPDEPVQVSYRNRFNLLMSVLKMRLSPSREYQTKRANTFS